MPGHSQGHAAVAVEADGRGTALRAFEQVVATDRARIKQNHAALTHLRTTGVPVIPAHDLQVWESMRPSC